MKQRNKKLNRFPQYDRADSLTNAETQQDLLLRLSQLYGRVITHAEAERLLRQNEELRTRGLVSIQ